MSSTPDSGGFGSAGSGSMLEVITDIPRMQASVHLNATGRGACRPEDILELVKRSGLVLSEEEAAKLPQLATEIAEGPGNSTTLIARGIAACAAHEEVQWKVSIDSESHSNTSDVQPSDDSKRVDLRQIHRFVNVTAGQALCQFLKFAEQPGRDVFGSPLPIPVAPPPPLALAASVIRQPDGLVVAKEDGCVRFAKGVLSVEKVFEVAGNVDYKVGNIDFKGKVIIHGNVLDKFSVKASADVEVKGLVEDAVIEAGGDIVVAGGVTGRRSGKLHAGGSIKVRYLHGMTVEAGSNVVVEAGCYESKISAGGNVSVKAGAIVGGSVRANGSIIAASLGSNKAVSTTVASGILGATAADFEKVKAPHRQLLAEVRQLEQALGPHASSATVDPKLSPVQQADVRRLLEELAPKRERLKALSEEIARMGGSSISVSKMIFPNVVAQIDTVCNHCFTGETSGPISLRADLNTGALDIKPMKAG